MLTSEAMDTRLYSLMQDFRFGRIVPNWDDCGLDVLHFGSLNSEVGILLNLFNLILGSSHINEASFSFSFFFPAKVMSGLAESSILSYSGCFQSSFLACNGTISRTIILLLLLLTIHTNCN